jgi:predicted amidophosphoribosyltransferase
MARPSILGTLADLVLPRCCAGCGVPGAVLCAACCASLARPAVASPRRFPWGFPPTVAAGSYAGPVRPAVVAFKERGRVELAAPLGTALALAVAAVVAGVPGPPRAVLLVPLPSSAAARRGRGRDHVRELTAVAVAELRSAGLAAEEAVLLRRTGRLRDSAGLSVAERRANLSGTFALVTAPVPPPDAVLVLVDDVVTTGATLTEAAAVLAGARPAGAAPVLAAVVAATPRRNAPGPPGNGTPQPVGRLSGQGSRD